jgi:predicted DNA-binding transcriptional regulator AlpA
MKKTAVETQPFPAAPSRLVDEHQTAAILGLSVKTLRRWRWAGREVPFIKLGGAVRYDLADLQAYIDGHRCQSTSMAVPGTTDAEPFSV